MTISNLKPFMAYLTFDQYARLKRFSSKNKVPMAQVIRESIDARIAEDDRYSHGYNTALQAAMRVVDENKAAKMRFPSGRSFAELVNADIKKLTLESNHEEREITAKAPHPGGDEGGAGTKDEGDTSLGV